MSRRSSRRVPKKAAPLASGVGRGLLSLVEGNEEIVNQMLSSSSPSFSGTGAEGGHAPIGEGVALVGHLADCMAVNDLSAEALLARFFDPTVLGRYCTERLGKSGKGNASTLAARIAREWAKPDFEPLPPPRAPQPSSDDGATKKKKKKVEDVRAGEFRTAKKRKTQGADDEGDRPDDEAC